MLTRLAIYNLRTNLRSHPREVDSPTPLFSWRLRSSGHGDDQTSYRIIVHRLTPAGDEAAAVWDSGWVDSNRVRVRYEGDPLVA
ncbi:MAG: hypothetical protein VB036_11715, partial [Propionicimonas sp.]|nr:hypothetical protein [Propionicimonas sp.]